jgi:endo-1,4-beta-xylanase
MPDRTVSTRLTVLDPTGSPLPEGTAVTVVQRSHRFLFGCIGFEFLDPANRETASSQQWFDLFNAATLPFYWGQFEPERGHPQTERLLDAARWLRSRGITVKGHPLAWHTLTAPWLLELSDDEIEHAVRGRIRREVTDFAGVIDLWDAINEVVIMPVFDKYDNGLTRLSRMLGRVGIVRMAFEEARAANPGATLLLNDFDLSADYEQLIEDCLAAGIKVDALGLQSHMHQGYWGEQRTLEKLERFARFGLPLHLTETTLLSGHLMPPEIVDLNDYQIPDWPSTPEGEARQAEEIVRHYRTLISHPAVEAVTYWGLSDDDAWLGAPVGLVRADGSPKPAFEALRELIKGEWWLGPTTLRTDTSGAILISGFAGEYGVSAGGAEAAFSLDPGISSPAASQLG